MQMASSENFATTNSSSFHDVVEKSTTTTTTTTLTTSATITSAKCKSSPAPKSSSSSIRQSDNMSSSSSSNMNWNQMRNKVHACIRSSSNSKAFMSCVLYSFCSVSMVLSNKSLATGNIDLNLLIVVFQAFFAVVCVETCKKLKWVEPYNGLDIKTAMQWAPVNLFFCGMLFSGMESLKHNSVPMVTIFKNVTNIVTATGDYFFFHNNTNDPLIIASFAITLGGAILAAKEDITATPMGLFWMVFNCFSTSGYVLYMKHATNSVKLSKFGMVYYNNVLCMVFLLPLARNQIFAFLYQATEYHTIGYAFKNMFAGFLGFFLNFASLNCVANTGPTTYAVVGSINKVPVTFLGYFLFDNVITPKTWFFIVVSLCGGFLYSYAKITRGGGGNNDKSKTNIAENKSSNGNALDNSTEKNNTSIDRNGDIENNNRDKDAAN